MDDFDIAPTRKDTYNLLKVFNRNLYEKEFIQYRATEMLTKNIIVNSKLLDLTSEQKKYIKTDHFKDELFILLKSNLTNEKLKHLTHLKIDNDYVEIISELNTIIFDDLLNNFPSKFENISQIITSFFEHIVNDLDLKI